MKISYVRIPLLIIGMALLPRLGDASPVSLESGPSTVTIESQQGEGFILHYNGEPFTIKGAVGRQYLESLVKLGGNSIRTYGIDSLNEKIDGKPVLDRCAELGIAVTVGIGVKHERHGFDYNDEKLVQEQREIVRAAVRQYKDHPAVLMWGLGNEMEGLKYDSSNTQIWEELNELAKIIKSEDERHPVMSVTAGISIDKAQDIMRHYPEIDVLGINAYGSARRVPKTLHEAGWSKPIVLTEFGPRGHWEVEKTAWGAPIEQTDKEKAESYYTAHMIVTEEAKHLCLGTYAFRWGHKQEATSTWFGMLLPDGTKLPPVDAMSYVWTGKYPENLCPQIETVKFGGVDKKIRPKEIVEVIVMAKDLDGDNLNYDYEIMQESADRKDGGDRESKPNSLPECILESNGETALIKMPEAPGAYRLFLTVYDGRGSASRENIPFLIEE